MAGKKPAQQQEMAQVGQTERSSSPFWRSRPPAGRQSSSRSNTVIGASYSHADMLKFDSLNLGSHSRPRTPPTSTSTPNNRSTATPPPTTAARVQSPSRQSYASYMTESSVNWNEEDDNEGEEEDFMYDDDEDEFGLPSLASMRRKKSKNAKKNAGRNPDPPGGSAGRDTDHLSSFALGRAPQRERANSSDIAEERGAPSYPSARKSEGKILRPQYKDILKDPANSLHLINYPHPPLDASTKEIEAINTRKSRINKFKRILQASSVPLSDLRDLAWSGIPDEVRAMTWQLLLGYLPVNSERRVATLEKKRREYLDGVAREFPQDFSAQMQRKNGLPRPASAPPVSAGQGRREDEAIWHQISIDVPRTNPHLELYGYEATQRSLERILFLWAKKHPASGYVQGINDLVTPFWQVFLGTYITDLNIESGMDPGQLPKPVLDAVEADSYWCLTKLLDGIQDNYIVNQPGIHKQVGALRDLVERIDAGLVKHLESEGLEFMQFSFRWVNCLLMREVSIKNTIRMWDTYIAEGEGFSKFHLYVCAAFLIKWSEKLMKMDFQEAMMFLQALPTREWTEKDIELILSEAFIWQSLYRDSSAHLRGSTRSVSGPAW